MNGPFSFIAAAWKRFMSFPGEGVAPHTDDGQSVLSNSSTLSGGSKHAQSPPSPAISKPVTMDASSTSFAKAAKQEGWGAPTATRPSLGI